MSKKSINKQLEELKKQAEQLKIAEKEFLKRQEIEAEERRKAEEEEKAKIKPYKVFGRDFSVTDPDAMLYYKNRMRMMRIQYQLVGYVNEEGEYIIPDKIKYDLIEMKKAIDEMGDDYYKVTALFMKKHFNFTIKLTMLEDGMAKATLNIAEYVGDFVDGETIYTFVAEFVDKYDADFRVKLRKVFNLYDVEVKNDDFNVPNLAVLMQDLYDLDQYIGGLYDISAQIYVMRMLKLLEEGGENEKDILEIYRQLLEQAEITELEETKQGKLDKVKPNKLGQNEKLRELLDKAIDKKGGLEKLTVDKKQLGNVLAEVNKTDKAIGELKVGGILEVSLPDSKPDKKGGSGGKGGSAKKKAKKKEDKKKDDKKKGKKKKDDKKKDNKNSGKGVELSKDSDATEELIKAVEKMRENTKDLEIVAFEMPKKEKPQPEKKEDPKEIINPTKADVTSQKKEESLLSNVYDEFFEKREVLVSEDQQNANENEIDPEVLREGKDDAQENLQDNANEFGQSEEIFVKEEMFIEAVVVEDSYERE